MLLHIIQPLARLWGRCERGLTPWRLRGRPRFTLPAVRRRAIWSERWREPIAWLHNLEAILRREGACVLRGGDYDRWEIELRRGLLASARVRLVIEEHGGGRQLARLRVWPRYPARGPLLALVLGAAGAAALFSSPPAAAILVLLALAVVAGTCAEAAAASGMLHWGIDELDRAARALVEGPLSEVEPAQTPLGPAVAQTLDDYIAPSLLPTPQAKGLAVDAEH